MKILSISEVIDLNNILKEDKIFYKVHLCDACGGQSFWIENLDENQEKNIENVVKAINEFFVAKRMDIKFSEDKKSFWVTK